MSPKVYKCFNTIINDHYSKEKPEMVLEIGTYRWSLLDVETFSNSKRYGLNLEFSQTLKDYFKDKHVLIEANSNNLPFNENYFDCIVSCSVLEHDKYFWKSIHEMKRALKPGGLMVIGVPVYTKLLIDRFKTTLTYHKHGISYNADFYRFSEQAVREVFFEGFQITNVIYVRKYPNPYLVVSGVKV